MQSNQRQLSLRVQGGFCNRLRAIVSAVLWAEDINASLEIHWPVEVGHMPCRLEEILDVRTIPRFSSGHAGYLRNARQIMNHADMKMTVDLVEKHIGNEIRIESYSEFHQELVARTDRALKVLRGIALVPSLDSIRPMKAIRPIGIHVRRTDHVKCIEASPLTSFEKAIELELLLNPGATFYLATDEVAVKMRLANLFGKSIESPTHFLGRKTILEQQNGIVDWNMLQQCSKILASKGSSYSEIAALRAGIELVVV